ncbi:hypothetical protein Tco_1002529 [Tanacetum coccineum]|uniref:Uncharacterized protein n=1 Tax=Tanacetum coccineum TaxID=301880 RepID=A0ABQ5F6I5_9ASTR
MSMLVKDIRSQDGIDDKDNDKGSKSRSQSMKEQAYNKQRRQRQEYSMLKTTKSNLTDLMKGVINELTSGEIVSLNFIESIKEARSRVQDLTSGEIVSLNLLSRTRKFGHSTMELRIARIFEASRAHGFCPSFTRASNP